MTSHLRATLYGLMVLLVSELKTHWLLSCHLFLRTICGGQFFPQITLKGNVSFLHCTVSYDNWYPNQPDNYYYPQDCAIQWFDGFWADDGCTLYEFLLCVKQVKLVFSDFPAVPFILSHNQNDNSHVGKTVTMFSMSVEKKLKWRQHLFCCTSVLIFSRSSDGDHLPNLFFNTWSEPYGFCLDVTNLHCPCELQSQKTCIFCGSYSVVSNVPHAHPTNQSLRETVRPTAFPPAKSTKWEIWTQRPRQVTVTVNMLVGVTSQRGGVTSDRGNKSEGE